MKALILKLQPVETGFIVVQVEPDENVFEVAEGLEWVTCPDTGIEAHRFWYDFATEQFHEVPVFGPPMATMDQPTVVGAQTL